jgi:hypothetical protein
MMDRMACHSVSARVLGILLAALLPFAKVSAQELEYKMEIGPMLGGSFYLGDANYSSFYSHTKGAAGALLRYNLNPRMAVKFNLAYAGVGGNSAERSNKYPDAKNWKFDSSVYDASFTYELNFFSFGTGTAGYKGNKRFTPYIQLGLGFTYAKGVEPEGSEFAVNLPFGFGFKYKVMDRLNVGLDWSMHFTTTDKIDGIVDPYGIKGSMFKNRDSYCTTMLYVTYDFLPKRRKCNN